jgi:transposase
MIMKKSYDSKFKSKVALEAIRGERSIAEIASDFGVHSNLVRQWKKKVLNNLSEVFFTKSERNKSNVQSNYPEDELLRQIGQLKVENEFMRKKYEQWVGKLD